MIILFQVHHHVGGNDLQAVSSIKFDFGAQAAKGAKTPGTNRVFKFTGNKVTTVMKSKLEFGTGQHYFSFLVSFSRFCTMQTELT